MTILTEVDIALLKDPNLAHVATVDSGGSPHCTPVWIDTDGKHILFNTAKGRVKYRNLAGNPIVAISISDKQDDYRTLWVKGTTRFVEEGADAHIDELAKKYLGVDSYPFRQPDEVRVIVEVTPTVKLGAR